MEGTGRAEAPRPKLKKSFSGVSPTDYLLARTRPLVEEARYTTRALHKSAFLASLIYEGKHRFYYSADRDWYYQNPGENEPTTLYHADNYYRFLLKSNTKEYLKSAPSIRARAPQLEDDVADEAARIADSVKTDFARRKRPTSDRRREFGRVQLAGNIAQFVDWSPGGGEKVGVSMYAQESFKPAPDSFTCYGEECGFEAEGDLAEQGIAPSPDGAPVPCPMCGGTETEAVTVPEAARNVPVGTLDVPAGDWIVKSVSALELTVNANARDHADLSDVIWLRWQYLQPRAVAEYDYEGVELPGATVLSGTDEDRGLRYQQYLAAAIGGTESPDWIPISPWADQVICCQDWFTPAAYAEYEVAPGDQWPLQIDGQEIVLGAGQRLTEAFPHGCQFIHYGSACVGLNPKGTEKKTAIQRHWNFAGFDPKAESFWYSGTEDAIPLQLELNEVNSYIKTFVKTSGMPMTAVRTDYVEDMGLSSNPSKIISITQEAPEGPISDIIQTYPPGNPGQGVYEFRQSLRAGMEYATGALNNFNGTDNADRTATQTSILQASALAHAEAVIDGLQESEARLYGLAVELWRENNKVPRAFEVKSDYGDTEMVSFSGADLDVDIEFVVEPGTVLPRRPYQERDDFEGYLKQKMEYQSVTGQPMDEELEATAANIYGLSSAIVKSKRAERRTKLEIQALSAVAQDADAIVGQMAGARLQQIAAIPDEAPEPEGPAEDAAEGPEGEAVEPPPDPRVMKAQAAMMLEQQTQTPEGQAALILEWVATAPEAPAPAKIVMQSDDHHGIIVFLRRFLNGDRGLKAPPLVRALLAARISERWQALGAQAAEETQAKMIAQAPEMQMQMAQQAAQAQQQTEGSVAVERERGANRNSPPPARGAKRDGDSSKKSAQKSSPTPKRKSRTEDS